MSREAQQNAAETILRRPGQHLKETYMYGAEEAITWRVWDFNEKKTPFNHQVMTAAHIWRGDHQGEDANILMVPPDTARQIGPRYECDGYVYTVKVIPYDMKPGTLYIGHSREPQG